MESWNFLPQSENLSRVVASKMWCIRQGFAHQEALKAS